LRASPLLQMRAKEHPKVKFIWNSVITEVLGSDKVESVRLKNIKTGEESIFETDGVFIFIGHTPNTGLFKGQLEMDPRGYLKIDEKMQTTKAGIFAAGEAADSNFRQVVTSAGMGAAAAIQATRFLEAESG
jgi:thioredoxin reductase (NADPH)